MAKSLSRDRLGWTYSLSVFGVEIILSEQTHAVYKAAIHADNYFVKAYGGYT